MRRPGRLTAGVRSVSEYLRRLAGRVRAQPDRACGRRLPDTLGRT